MSDSTRRHFLTTIGLGTAAGVAAVAVGPSTADATTPDEPVPADANGPMAAYIYDVRKHQVALMIEGREVVVTDRRLVARLANAFASASRA